MNTSLTSAREALVHFVDASHTDKVLMNTANLLIKANLKIVELKKEKKKIIFIFIFIRYFNNSYNNLSCISASYILSLIFSPLRSETK
jgi:hypothetical protein